MWGSTVRGSWRPNRNCNILTLLLWPSALCLSCSPDAQPETQRPTLLGDGFSTTSYQQLPWTTTHQSPKAPFGLMWLSLPHLVNNSVRSLTVTRTDLTSVLTELYNSSTPTQSPTWSLKSHVWSSSSGNNCHAVTDHSLPVHQSMRVSWDFLPRPISNFRPRDFLS